MIFFLYRMSPIFVKLFYKSKGEDDVNKEVRFYYLLISFKKNWIIYFLEKKIRAKTNNIFIF